MKIQKLIKKQQFLEWSILEISFNNEIESIMNNHNWELVDLPRGTKSKEYKWVLLNGSIDKFKAKLVVKGFKENKGLDIFDTYAPVTRITIIRILIAIA